MSNAPLPRVISGKPWIIAALSAVNSSESDPVKPEPKKKALKSKKILQVIYPIFEECKTYTEDPYWKGIFDQAARGIFPCKVHFDSTTLILTHKKNAKNDEVSIPNSQPEAYNAALCFFHLIGLKSAKEEENEQEQADILTNNLVSLDSMDWKAIRQKKVKQSLISWFVQDLARSLDLSDSDARKILDVINIGFNIKAFSNSDVIFKEGKIQGINGLIKVNKGNCIHFIIDPQKISIHSDFSRKKYSSDDDEDGYESDSSISTSISSKRGTKKSRLRKTKDDLLTAFVKILEALNRPPNIRRSVIISSGNASQFTS